MYQRFRPPCADAIAKPYRFVELNLLDKLDGQAADATDITDIIDAVADEVRATAIPWIPSQWKWHMQTWFCVLRAGEDEAYAGAGLVRANASIDRPIVARMPHLCRLLDQLFARPVVMAWLGKSPAGARIYLHRDNTDHWDCHHRIHIPLITNPQARLCVADGFVHMPAGSAWALNNSLPHGAHNGGDADRIHLIVDLAPGPDTDALLNAGRASDGQRDNDALAALSQDPLKALHPGQLGNFDLIRRLLLQ